VRGSDLVVHGAGPRAIHRELSAAARRSAAEQRARARFACAARAACCDAADSDRATPTE